MAKTDTLAMAAVEAKKMGMSYGQYTTYLACHKDENVRKKSPYNIIEEATLAKASTGEGA